MEKDFSQIKVIFTMKDIIRFVVNLVIVSLGALGVYIITSVDEQNDSIRHFHTNCKETHNTSDKELKEIKDKLEKIQAQLSLFPQIKTSK